MFGQSAVEKEAQVWIVGRGVKSGLEKRLLTSVGARVVAFLQLVQNPDVNRVL